MDYHALPRKQLQALCKKHGIPANATNSEMADALGSLLKPKAQLHAANSKQPEKRVTRSRETAMSETLTKSNDGENGSNMWLQKDTSSHKILEEDSNKQQRRKTRGRGSASVVSEAPKSSELKTLKVSTDGETETKSATEQKETKQASTRNGCSKQDNNEMPLKTEENKDTNTSPSDKKKEKAGGIVLRRGKIKVRSQRNLSKSPELAQVTKEVAGTVKEKGVGMSSNQSCLVDVKKTRKKKRSVTFSEVIEISSAHKEHSAGDFVSENIEEPANETTVENQQGVCMAKDAVLTRKASRIASTDVLAPQAVHQISKESVPEVSKAKRLPTFDTGKSSSIEINGESDKERATRDKKTQNSVDDASVKENDDAKNGHEFTKGAHIESIPCIRRSRRLTIVPAYVNSNHDTQLTSGVHPEGISIAPKGTEGDLSAERTAGGKKALNSVDDVPAKENEKVKIVNGFTQGDHIESVPYTRRSRRLAIVPTDVKSNHDVQLTTEFLKGQSKDPYEGISIAPKRTEGDLFAETSSSSRRNSLAPLELNYMQSTLGSADGQMKKISKAKVTQKKSVVSERRGEAIQSQQKRLETKRVDSKTKSAISNKADVQPIKTKEEISSRKLRGSRQEAFVASAHQQTMSAEEVSNENDSQKLCSTEKISGKLENNGVMTLSDKLHSKAAQNTGILVNSEPDSVKEFSNDAKTDVETLKSTLLTPEGTQEASKVLTRPDCGTAVSQALSAQTNIMKQEDLVTVDEAVAMNTHESEDLGVIAQACLEKDQDNLIVKDTNVPNVEELVSSSPSNEDINHSDSLLCALQVVIGEEGQVHNGMSEGDSGKTNLSPEETSCATTTECVLSGHEFPQDVIDQKGHATDESATITSPTKDLEDKSRSNQLLSVTIQDNGIQDESKFEGQRATAEHKACLLEELLLTSDEGLTANRTSGVAAIAESKINDQISIDMATAELKTCPVEVDLLTSDADQNAYRQATVAADLVEQQPYQAEDKDALDELAIKVHAVELKNSTEIHTDEDISVAASFGSKFEDQTFRDIATAERKVCTFDVHLLSSDKDKIANMTSGVAADLREQQHKQEAHLNLCEEEYAVDKVEINGDLQKEQLQDTNEGLAHNGVNSVDNGISNPHLGLLSPIVPSNSEDTPTRESAHKMKQRCPRSIYKSAREAECSVPCENTSLEEYVTSHPDEEANINPSDQVKKGAESWSLNNHEMTGDETDSASSEDEESFAETDETLSETEICDFNTEMLNSNTEGDYSSSEDGENSSSEDDTPSDSEKDTMFDSEVYFSEVEEELLSGEECYEREEQETSEEELSESEDDAGDDFNEYEVYPVEVIAASSLPNDESMQAEFINDWALENDIKDFNAGDDFNEYEVYPLEIIAASCLPNDGSMQAEFINWASRNDIKGCAPMLEPRDAGETVGEQHEELQNISSIHAVTDVQDNVDVLVTSNDNETSNEDEVSPVSQSVTSPPNLDALHITDGLKDERVKLVAASSLPNDGCMQAEMINHLALENDIDDVGPMGCVNGKVSGQHEELQNTLSMHAGAEIEKNVDLLMTSNDSTAIERVESATYSTKKGSDALTSQSSFFSSPASYVEDIECSSAPLSILESKVSQQLRPLETEPNSLLESRRDKNVQLCFPCELSQEEVMVGVGHHTMDGAKLETELCVSVGGAEELEIAGQMAELVQDRETEPNILPQSEQKKSLQFCFPCELPHEEVIAEVGVRSTQLCFSSELSHEDQSMAEVGQHAMDGDRHGTELCVSVGGVEKELEIDCQMVELVQDRETEPNSLAESRQGKSLQLCFSCELSHKDQSIAEVGQHTMDGDRHGTELCVSVGGVEKELEIDVQMVELVQDSETEPNILAESRQDKSSQLFCPCEHTHEEVIVEVRQHTIDGAEHETELRVLSGGGVEKPEIDGQMIDLVQYRETEAELLTESGLDRACYPCELSQEKGIAEVGQPTMEGTKHETELFVSIGGVAQELEIDGEMVELVQDREELRSGSVAHELEIDGEMVELVQDREELQSTLSMQAAIQIQENVGVLMNYNDNTAMEQVQSMIRSECQDIDLLTSLSSLFATPPAKLQEDAKCCLTPSSIGIFENDVSQQSKALENELNIFTKSRQEEAVQLCFPCELMCKNVTVEVKQQEINGAKHESDLYKSEGGAELESKGQMIEPIQESCMKNSLPEPVVVDHLMPSPMLDDVDESQLLESSHKEAKQKATESQSQCIDPSDLILENTEVEMGDPLICEDVIQNLNVIEDQQEEPGNSTSDINLSCVKEEDEAGNAQVKNDLDNNEGSVGMAPDALNGSEALGGLLNLGEVNTTTELTKELMTTESSTLAMHGESSEKEKEDKETGVAHPCAEISKEECMKQIDQTLMSVRQLRQMCKTNLTSAKKKTSENETPSKTPSKLWISATKQVAQPNTPMHPSATKRSALKALSSNIKATPSATQTPTAKGSQRPRYPYDGNDGIAKQLITPSPKAPVSLKRDFAKSNHR